MSDSGESAAWPRNSNAVAARSLPAIIGPTLAELPQQVSATSRAGIRSDRPTFSSPSGNAQLPMDLACNSPCNAQRDARAFHIILPIRWDGQREPAGTRSGCLVLERNIPRPEHTASAGATATKKRRAARESPIVPINVLFERIKNERAQVSGSPARKRRALFAPNLQLTQSVVFGREEREPNSCCEGGGCNVNSPEVATFVSRGRSNGRMQCGREIANLPLRRPTIRANASRRKPVNRIVAPQMLLRDDPQGLATEAVEQSGRRELPGGQTIPGQGERSAARFSGTRAG